MRSPLPRRRELRWRGTAAIGAIFALLLGLAMGAFIRLDQLPGDRRPEFDNSPDEFAEGQKAVTVAAVLDEGRLQRRLYAGDLAR